MSREAMPCVSTGSGAVLDVTGFDKKNKLLQSCNKKSVTKFFVTNYLLQLRKTPDYCYSNVNKSIEGGYKVGRHKACQWAYGLIPITWD
jgi:hypothetical protein